MRFQKSKYLVLPLTFLLFMMLSGTILAWDISIRYRSESLYTGSDSYDFSPSDGYFNANVGNDGSRWTNPVGQYIYWNPHAVNYIRKNGSHVAITHHSFSFSNGCSTFAIGGSGGTNLPAPEYRKYVRQCWHNGRPTEGRLVNTDPNQLQDYEYYWGQVFYREQANTSETQKFTIDTYYGSDKNYHQVYCIAPGQNSPHGC